VPAAPSQPIYYTVYPTVCQGKLSQRTMCRNSLGVAPKRSRRNARPARVK
jgi:hypothetical protein